MVSGKIRWFSDPLGYGFIERDDGQSVFVHYTEIPQASGVERLRPGQQVEFEIHQTLQGPQATRVNRK